MSLASLDFLAPVIATILAAGLGRLEGLTIDATGTGLGVAAFQNPDIATQGVEDAVPGSVLLPGSEVDPDGTLGQQVMGGSSATGRRCGPGRAGC